jgi:hypothetical protein
MINNERLKIRLAPFWVMFATLGLIACDNNQEADSSKVISVNNTITTTIPIVTIAEGTIAKTTLPPAPIVTIAEEIIAANPMYGKMECMKMDFVTSAGVVVDADGTLTGKVVDPSRSTDLVDVNNNGIKDYRFNPDNPNGVLTGDNLECFVQLVDPYLIYFKNAVPKN